MIDRLFCRNLPRITTLLMPNLDRRWLNKNPLEQYKHILID